MDWNKVRLIFQREVRDQLRDRRTLFMIAVLPLLLYPLLGMSMLQVLQFVQEHATRVLLVGVEELPAEPPLVDNDKFAASLFDDPAAQRLLNVKTRTHGGEDGQAFDETAARAAVASEYEAVIVFPPDFAERLAAFRKSLKELRDGSEGGEAEVPTIPNPELYFNTASEKSQITNARVSRVLTRWTDEIGRQNLVSSNLPASAVRPFELRENDLASESRRDAAMWSKILPFLLLIWALTGAFYPAIDLCAGEKERGTLETLLISPAERVEIVWGKLLTVMAFSVVTSILNLISIGVTGGLILSQLPRIGPPPVSSLGWLFLALVPMGALFSALCLALAAFARSTKEGQYYLMPLLFVTMPLMILPMAPGVELNLGNSLIPVTGVVLLLRSMLEGDYWNALPFALPVTAVTLGCCLLAIRWAVDQFNKESVLFRESERLDMGLWLRHLLRDRENTPSPAEAIACCVLILITRFFMSFSATMPTSFQELMEMALVTQLVVIATPALLMTIMLTRSPRQTLSLTRPPLMAIPAAVLLAIAAHPMAMGLMHIVNWLYPLKDTGEAVAKLLADAPSIWMVLFCIALAPAICEELAFRGFVLSGFRRSGHKWRAIALSSFFFGITHPIMQQSIVATIVGMVIGYVAVQSGSIWPAMLYHLTHNSLTVLITQYGKSEQFAARFGWLFQKMQDESVGYSYFALLVSGIASIALLYWFHTLHYRKTPEEIEQDAIHEAAAEMLTTSTR